MNLPAPVPLAKKDTPRSAPVAALLNTTIKTIAKGAKTLTTKQALASFWTALTFYAQRNLAEVEGTGAPPAAAPAKAAAAKTAAPKTRKTRAAGAATEPAPQTAAA